MQRLPEPPQEICIVMQGDLWPEGTELLDSSTTQSVGSDRQSGRADGA